MVSEQATIFSLQITTNERKSEWRDEGSKIPMWGYQGAYLRFSKNFPNCGSVGSKVNHQVPLAANLVRNQRIANFASPLRRHWRYAQNEIDSLPHFPFTPVLK